MARKELSLLPENCNGEMQAKGTSGHADFPNGCVGQQILIQIITSCVVILVGTSIGFTTVSLDACKNDLLKLSMNMNGKHSELDQFALTEPNTDPESVSTSSEENTSDTNYVSGIKPRSFYSSQNKRQKTRSAVRKPIVQRNKPKMMANGATCDVTRKDTQHCSKTMAVKRKQDRFSNEVPAKKIRSSKRYNSDNAGRTFRDNVFGRHNCQNENFEDRRLTRNSFKKSRDNPELCNGTQNGKTECSDKESVISSDLQEDMLCSFSNSSDAQSGHSLHQAFFNGHMKSDFELSCSEGSEASGSGVLSSELVQKTNCTEHNLNPALDVDLMVSEDKEEHKEDSTSDEQSNTLDSIESVSSQKTIPLFSTSSLISGISFSPGIEDLESISSSSRSSPENQASIMKYFKSLPGQNMSKNNTITQRDGGDLCTSPVGTGRKSKSRSPYSRKSTEGRRLEQMYLDLGQKDFGHVTCQTCGMVYTKAQPDDEAEHIKHHKRFVGGLKFMGWKNERVVQEFHDGRVIMVTPDDHSLHTKKVEEIRKVVDAELGFASEAPFRKQESKTFLFISNKRIVGCAVAVQIDKGYPVLPNNNSNDTTPDRQLAAWCCSSTPQPAQCGISRIWVYSSFRRKKIATRLIDCVRTNLIYGCIILKDMLAFSDPTPDGKRLAQSYAGTCQFLVFR